MPRSSPSMLFFQNSLGLSDGLRWLHSLQNHFYEKWGDASAFQWDRTKDASRLFYCHPIPIVMSSPCRPRTGQGLSEPPAKQRQESPAWSYQNRDHQAPGHLGRTPWGRPPSPPLEHPELRRVKTHSKLAGRLASQAGQAPFLCGSGERAPGPPLAQRIHPAPVRVAPCAPSSERDGWLEVLAWTLAPVQRGPPRRAAPNWDRPSERPGRSTAV